MAETELIELFEKVTSEEKCPKCKKRLTGGYYNPDGIVKGPSDGFIAYKVPIEEAMKLDDPAAFDLVLYVECEDFGKGCNFRTVFYPFYKEIKNRKKAAKKGLAGAKRQGA